MLGLLRTHRSLRRSKAIRTDELLDEFVRVANSMSKLPTAHEFIKSARFSWRPYKDRWGPGWPDVQKALSDQCANRFHFNIRSLEQSAATFKTSIPLKLPLALLNRPRNEIETVILFSLLADKLRYKIEACGSAFPDVMLIDQDGNRIAAEFEYLSSNYLQHGHPLSFGGVCICWRKDVELGAINVISLEEYLRPEV